MRYDVLDTPPEPQFDAITDLVKSIFDVQAVVISLVDQDRQWFKSRQGVAESETPRSMAFCDYTIQADTLLSVPDTTRDERFRNNPLVLGEPHIRSYFGVPLVTPDGYSIGSICIIDLRPRSFTPAQLEILGKFGAMIMAALEQRQEARHDRLTGALSRAAFLDILAVEMVRSRRTYTPSSLGLLNLDGFEAVDRSLGKGAGNALLSQVAEVCHRTLRPYDVMGRVGPHRLGLLMPGADGNGVEGALTRLRERLAAVRPDGPTCIGRWISLGAAEYVETLDNPEDWLSASQAALERGLRL